MSKQGKTNYVTQQQLKTVRGGRGVGHIHSNKDTLDQITPEFFANMSETVSLAHSHNNRVAIDSFSYDPETNTIYVGDEDDPVNFAAFGDVAVGGLPGGSTPTGAQYLYQLTDVPDYRNDSTKVGKVLKVGSNNTIVWGDGASSFGQISGSPYDNTGLATALNGKANSSAIADMATKTWVNGRGFLTEITSSMVITALGNTAVAKATDADTLDGQHASHFASASDLETVLALLNKIDSWIGYDEDNNAIYIKKDADNNARNFYTFGDVAVGGPGSGGGGGASYLYQLEDVPDYRTSYRGKYLRAKSDGSGVEWVDVTGGVSSVINLTGDISQAQLRTALGLGSLAYANSLGWANLTNNANSLKEGDSDVTDNTELLTSYASNNGFSDPNAVGKVYKRDAIKVYNYVKTKLGLGSAAYTASSAYATATQGSHGETAYGWGNHANAGYATQTWVKGSIPALVTAGGRVYNSGDDEGIIISRASNGFAGLILGSSSGVRSVFYLCLGNPFWRYNNGTTSFDISHPAKSGTIALTSDIPTSLSQLSADTTHRLVTDTQITAWNGKWDYNENTIKAVKVNNAGNADNADTVDSLHANSFAQWKTFSSPDVMYDFGWGRIFNGSGSPSEDQYGVFLTMPYRKATGNTTPDFAWQIFGPNGDEHTHPDDIFVRTSLATSWRTWHKLYHSGNCNNTSTPWSCSNLTASGTVAPSGDRIYTLGTASAYWDDFYVKGVIHAYHYDKAANQPFIVFDKPGSYVAGIGSDGTSGRIRFGPVNSISSSNPSWIDASTFASNEWYFQGNIVTTSDLAVGSDRRWKDNITAFSANVLNALRPVEWDWKEGHGDGHSCGFVAQDIMKIMPYAVKGNEESGYTLNYNVFHAVWARSLQSHETRIAMLERENAELRQQIRRLQINS